MSTIYERITKLCNENDISGYRLAKDIGTSPSFLTDLKAGRLKGLSAAKVTKIANYFGVSVDYLLTGEKEKPATEGDGLSDDLQLAISQASDRQKELVRRILGYSDDQIEAFLLLTQSSPKDQ